MRKPKEELSSIIKDYALIAQAVYNPDQKTVGDWNRVSDEKLISLKINPKLIQKDEISYKASIYENKKGDLVVAFAGTENLLGKDMKTNLKQGVGLKEEQYDLALELGRQVKEKLSDRNVVITGHSLGGGLATAASAASDRKAITFNSAGVHENTLKRQRLDVEDFKQKAEKGQVTNHVVKNEILNHKVQRIPHVPKAMGKEVIIDVPKPSSRLRRATQLVTSRLVGVRRHFMENVIKAVDNHIVDKSKNSQAADKKTELESKASEEKSDSVSATKDLSKEKGDSGKVAKSQNAGLKSDNAKDPTTQDLSEVNQEKVLKKMEEKLQSMGKSESEIKQVLDKTKKSMDSNRSKVQINDSSEKTDVTTKKLSEINQEKVIKSMEEKLRSRGKDQSEINQTISKANSIMNENRSNTKDQVKVKVKSKAKVTNRSKGSDIER